MPTKEFYYSSKNGSASHEKITVRITSFQGDTFCELLCKKENGVNLYIIYVEILSATRLGLYMRTM